MSIFNKTAALLAMALLTVSCASNRKSVDTDYWKQLVASDKFATEKKIYKERTGGKDFCWSVGVSDFLTSTNVKPSKDCFYPSSKLFTQLSDSWFVKEKELKQEMRQLKVIQVTSEGFLVQSSNVWKNQIIFIHKTEESGIVDDSYLDENSWLIYEYAGTYSYNTNFGSKTVHSFRKISEAKFSEFRKDFTAYQPVVEFWVQNELWQYLVNKPKNFTY